jgi:hypothetical protein
MDLNWRCWSLYDTELYLNRWENDVRGTHAGGRKSAIDREASGSETGPNRAGTGLGRSAQAGWPGVFWARFAPPLTHVLLYILPLPTPAATSIHSSESRQHEGEALEGSRQPPQVLESPRRWLRPCPSHHGWPCVVKPWWSSGAHVLVPSRQLYILHSMVI